MPTITLPAYAKINLYLGVTGIDENGYHTVETVMQAITLHDHVTVTLSDDPAASADEWAPDISLSCSNPDIPCDETNLAWRAALLYCSRLHETQPDIPAPKLHIYIEKRIPAAGGLAGGSSDAAAVFTALNHLLMDPLSRSDLLTLGAALGADVPFCVLASQDIPTALGLHYGERMTVLPPMPQMYCVAASLGEGCPTPWAYGLVDQLPTDPVGGFRPITDALLSADPARITALMYNRFEEAILPQRPGARLCRDILQRYADRVLLSGSGSAVIGLFSNPEKATLACAALEEAGAVAALCETLQRSQTHA